MSARLGPIRPEDMDAAQRALFDAITGGARGSGDPAEFLNEDGALRGPFNVLLRSPEIGDAVQRVGEGVRFKSVLPGTLRELAILVCARHWRANYEWYAHAKVARKEGLSDATIDAVMDERPPEEAQERVVYDFARALNTTGHPDDTLYDAANGLFGERGVVELTTLIGYYGLISHLLNVFRVPLPAGEPKPFGK